MFTPIQKEEARFWKGLKPQLTSVGSVVVDLAGVDQDRVGVKKLMALKKKIQPFLKKVKSWSANLIYLLLQLVNGQDDVLEDLLGEGHGPDRGGGRQLHEGGLGGQHPAE